MASVAHGPAAAATRWWADLSLRTKGMLVLAMPLVMSLVATCVFFAVLAETDGANDRVSAARGSTARIAQLSGLVLDGETGLRGYLATGDDRFLEPTTAATEQLPAGLTELGALVGHEPAQEVRLDRARGGGER